VYPCSSSCKTCSGSAAVCTSCDATGAFPFLFGSTCVSNCSPGSYLSAPYICTGNHFRFCLPIYSHQKHALQSVLLVLEVLVLVQHALVLGQLLSFTPVLAIQVVLPELLCPHQPYAMVFEISHHSLPCLACSSPCKTCSGTALTCTSCETSSSNPYSFNNFCWPSCPPGSYLSSGYLCLRKTNYFQDNNLS